MQRVSGSMSNEYRAAMEMYNGKNSISGLCAADGKRKKPKFDLRVKEVLFIRRYNCGPGNGKNEDLGSYVTTTQWEPVFHRIRGGGGTSD